MVAEQQQLNKVSACPPCTPLLHFIYRFPSLPSQELEIQQEDLQEAKKQQEVFEAAMRMMPVMEKELAKVKEDNKFFRYGLSQPRPTLAFLMPDHSHIRS